VVAAECAACRSEGGDNALWCHEEEIPSVQRDAKTSADAVVRPAVSFFQLNSTSSCTLQYRDVWHGGNAGKQVSK